MDWTIAPLISPAEIADVLAIEDASFTNPWTHEMYVAELARPGLAYCFIARTADRQAVGFCSFWRVVDELHINNLAVLPACRRGGVATSLLRHVLGEGARLGALRATLEVRRSNEAARRLYERLGFSVAGVRRAYYTTPTEDAIVLWREQLAGEP